MAANRERGVNRGLQRADRQNPPSINCQPSTGRTPINHPLLISKVLMPERGVFTVRVADDLVASNTVSEGMTGRFVVSLDYGEDVGTVIETAPYDPAVHGDRIPGFRLLRPLMPKDEAMMAENAGRADEMLAVFLEEARMTLPDLRIPAVRLSLGRRKLFLRYVYEHQRPDLSAAQEAVKRQFGVEVGLWAMGPRDEVAERGGLGPCGRVCCCCSWQRHYPSHLAPDRRNALPSLVNGTCGRFKCCLAFERDASPL